MGANKRMAGLSGGASKPDERKGEQEMEALEMTEKEQAAIMIDIYTDLQRIKIAEDKDKELSNQLRKAKAKLEALGIVTENLTIE